MKKDNLAKGVLAGVMAAGLSVGLMGFVSGCKTGECPFAAKKEIKQMNNAEFYKDGKFDSAKAKQAYFDMMKRFHVPVYAALQKDDGFFWAVDFKKDNFTSFGMGGVIWVNEKEEGYFGHDIFLLPGQSIAEHRHLPTTDKDGKTIRCKIESWLVRNGSVYGFSEVGTPNLNEFPEAKAMLSKVQIPYLKSVHVEKWGTDGVAHKLPGAETWHFMMGGSEGAIVTEFATYHDGNGLRFSVPNVGF